MVVSSDPTKTAAPSEHRSERSEQLEKRALASEASNMATVLTCPANVVTVTAVGFADLWRCRTH